MRTLVIIPFKGGVWVEAVKVGKSMYGYEARQMARLLSMGKKKAGRPRH